MTTCSDGEEGDDRTAARWRGRGSPDCCDGEEGEGVSRGGGQARGHARPRPRDERSRARVGRREVAHARGAGARGREGSSRPRSVDGG